LLAGLLAGCAGPVSDGVIATTAPNGAAERIPARVSKPEGLGPFPAVVIMHSDRPVRFVAARVNHNASGGRGATTGGDAAAWADSIRRVADFFGRLLGP